MDNTKIDDYQLVGEEHTTRPQKPSLDMRKNSFSHLLLLISLLFIMAFVRTLRYVLWRKEKKAKENARSTRYFARQCQKVLKPTLS
jgi:hypothetical protein